MGWSKYTIYVCKDCDKFFEGNQNTKKCKICEGRNIRLSENGDF